MDEYIKREYAVDAVLNVYCNTPDIDLSGEKFEAAILKIPDADVAPVVHGRWEWLGPNRLVTDCMCGTCSACKVRSKYIVNTMLCPNCGAKMDLHGECKQDGEC